MSSGDLDALLRVTSSTYRGETPDIAFGTYDGAVGRMILAVTGKGIVACSFEEENTVFERLARDVGTFIGPDPRRLDPVRRELDAYFSGRLRTFATPVDFALATSFARTVLQKTMAVPYGTTTTYEEIGASIGRPRALRAIGNAVGANPVCVIVPCHRVVREDGELGDYAGGVAAKQHLLNVERRASTAR
ncbi:MAG: methylated-DNA--[protein]-cysteine S-methyltransferase [Nonomuraea sp.]|nr:methylated-DNA--[protein]-cysteine S-methyltransferase [Nonomuraea sp.]NUP66080.1 methylated-DNA--[protein]-cysteine S-methyltransferase [Nonomuraea sp.]NUP78262.1 methylated-DNA--[protein]-cysteine S-methyltransferase [Nonomuraea sp.]NUS07090.1 methylated-DNA--[protein]-cysteine S-methyltransferase [Nonomuraea sp.]